MNTMPNCKECRWWKPDTFILYLGECEKKGRASLEGEGPCEAYALKKREEFMWCSDCRTTVHRSERARHRGHDLFVAVHVDSDAHEYTQAGD